MKIVNIVYNLEIHIPDDISEIGKDKTLPEYSEENIISISLDVLNEISSDIGRLDYPLPITILLGRNGNIKVKINRTIS